MFRLAGFALFAALAFAQQSVMPPEPPPPGVDEALRARIQEFYRYFISQQYRKSEKLVAEESQDWFYSASKPHYLSIEIRRIEYFDHFTRAKVLTLCEQNMLMMGFNGPMKIPTPSTWKLVDGQWFWYVDPQEISQTPFGRMPQRGALQPPAGDGRLRAIPTTADFALNRVRADKTSLDLKPDETGEVVMTNTAPGQAMLEIASKPAGVEAKLDPELLGPGAKAVLSVRAPKGTKQGAVVVRVKETGEMIPIQVNIN